MTFDVRVSKVLSYPYSTSSSGSRYHVLESSINKCDDTEGDTVLLLLW